MHSLDERPHDVGYDFWTEIKGALSSLYEKKRDKKKKKKSLEMFRVLYTMCVSLARFV